MKKWDKNLEYDVKEGILQGQGVRKLGGDICFTVAVPDKKTCSLLLYKKGKKEVEASIPMESSIRYGDLRSVLVKGLPAEKYEYNYRSLRLSYYRKGTLWKAGKRRGIKRKNYFR